MRGASSSLAKATENYFVGAVVSSITHGQKFCGLRVVAAFLMTVIFIILLRFW